MKTVVAVVLLLCVAAACAERNFVQRGYIGRNVGVGGNQPYWFLGGSRTRSNGVQAIQVPVSAADFGDDDEDDDDQEGALALVNDDEDEDNDDDLEENNSTNDDDDDDQELGFNGSNIIGIVPLAGGNTFGTNYWRSVLSKNGGNAGSILIPDGIIELDGQGIVDEETGETALFVPREALAGIPDGSVVALIEDPDSLGKAQKVIVRRRRKGVRGGNKRRRGNRRRRRGGNRRRRNGVRVIRPKPIQVPTRGGNQRRRVPNIIRI